MLWLQPYTRVRLLILFIFSFSLSFFYSTAISSASVHDVWDLRYDIYFDTSLTMIAVKLILWEILHFLFHSHRIYMGVDDFVLFVVSKLCSINNRFSYRIWYSYWYFQLISLCSKFYWINNRFTFRTLDISGIRGIPTGFDISIDIFIGRILVDKNHSPVWYTWM